MIEVVYFKIYFIRNSIRKEDGGIIFFFFVAV